MNQHDSEQIHCSQLAVNFHKLRRNRYEEHHCIYMHLLSLFLCLSLSLSHPPPPLPPLCLSVCLTLHVSFMQKHTHIPMCTNCTHTHTDTNTHTHSFYLSLPYTHIHTHARTHTHTDTHTHTHTHKQVCASEYCVLQHLRKGKIHTTEPLPQHNTANHITTQRSTAHHTTAQSTYDRDTARKDNSGAHLEKVSVLYLGLAYRGLHSYKPCHQHKEIKREIKAHTLPGKTMLVTWNTDSTPFIINDSHRVSVLKE